MRFVAGKGAVAELLLAWSRSGAFASRGAVTERHREEACQGAVAAEMLLALTLLAEKPYSSIGKRKGEALAVNVTFLQITAHTSKTQISHNQTINF